MKSTKLLACLVTLLLCGYPFTTALADELRTWTDVQGRTIQARLLHADLGKASIEIERADGVHFTLPIARLSATDQQFVQNWTPESAAPSTPPADEPDLALHELSPAQWEWLTQAGSMSPHNYSNFPAAQMVTLLNLRLSSAPSATAKTAIKGVRLDADAPITEIFAEIPNTVSLATFLKELAEQNSLQLRIDASGIIVLQRPPQKDAIKFLGM